MYATDLSIQDVTSPPKSHRHIKWPEAQGIEVSGMCKLFYLGNSIGILDEPYQQNVPLCGDDLCWPVRTHVSDGAYAGAGSTLSGGSVMNGRMERFGLADRPYMRDENSSRPQV